MKNIPLGRIELEEKYFVFQKNRTIGMAQATKDVFYNTSVISGLQSVQHVLTVDESMDTSNLPCGGISHSDETFSTLPLVQLFIGEEIHASDDGYSRIEQVHGAASWLSMTKIWPRISFR